DSLYDHLRRQLSERNISPKLKEAVEYIPIDKILLETDSPYLSPEPHRGERNSSLNLPYVAKEIAAIKGLSYEEVVERTEENARKLFGL
ncbi:MAG: TatD family hydrolase, partial [Lachnospiraceae bacterium]|nr:TatD family hydrolase [Lachnospiraceae bacterium]